MRNVIVICISFLLFIRCQTENEKLIKRIEPILKSELINLFKPDSLLVDSLRIYKIDTLTPAKDSSYVFSGLIESLEQINYFSDLQNQITRNSIDKAKLYTVFGGDLLEMQKREAKEDMEKGKKYLTISDEIFNRIQGLKKLDSLKQIDSVTSTGYIVRFKLKGADMKNKEIVIDSGSLLLNNELRIIDRRSDAIRHYSRLRENVD